MAKNIIDEGSVVDTNEEVSAERLLINEVQLLSSSPPPVRLCYLAIKEKNRRELLNSSTNRVDAKAQPG